MRKYKYITGREIALLGLLAACFLVVGRMEGEEVTRAEERRNEALSVSEALSPEVVVRAIPQSASLTAPFTQGSLSGSGCEPDEDERERIEEALVEQGYFREDIPLSYEEQDLLRTASEEFGVDYYIMVALIERETGFHPRDGDGGNSQGYCQIQKKWWADLMAEIGAEDLNDPGDNFRTACAILRQHLDRYGDMGAALTAYNKGHYSGTVSTYAEAVMEGAERWRG